MMCNYCRPVYDEYCDKEVFFYPTIAYKGTGIFGYNTALEQEHGEPVLVTLVDNMEGDEVDRAEIGIRFCPFCGTKQ